MVDIERLRQLSAGELAVLGMNEIAYVRRVKVPEGGIGFGIHTADGRCVAVSADAPTAFALIQEHDMLPVSLH